MASDQWAAVSVPLFQILPIVVLSRVGADGLECRLSLVPPGPCTCGYYVVKQGGQINLMDLIMWEEELSGFVAKLCQ